MARLLSHRRAGASSAASLSCSIAVLAIASSIAGCQQITLGVVYNTAETPLTISYAMPLLGSDGDAARPCPLDVDSGQRPRIQQGSPRGRLGVQHWTDVENYRSSDGPCHARFEIPPGHSALIFTNGLCADYAKFLGGAELRPTLDSLTLRDPTGERTHAGWETAKQFRRISTELCVLEFP